MWPTRSMCGASRARSAAGCCSGWRTMTGAARAPEYEAAALEDLEWLGLAPDLGTAGGAAPRRLAAPPERLRPCRMPRRWRSWPRTARVYACDCTRKDIAAEAGDPFNQETRYSGRCRDRGLPRTDGRGIRVRHGARRGDVRRSRCWEWSRRRPSEQCGDLLLRDRTGNWTYQFAVVVDDRSARGGPGRPRRGSAALDGPPDTVVPHAGPGTAAGVSPPSADPEAGRGQAQQVERRYRHQGVAAGGSVGRRWCWDGAAWLIGLLGGAAAEPLCSLSRAEGAVLFTFASQ